MLAKTWLFYGFVVGAPTSLLLKKRSGLKGMGWIRARCQQKGVTLWDRQIYRLKYDPGLERDVQRRFITRLDFQGDELRIESEVGTFLLHPETRKLTILDSPDRTGVVPVLEPNPPA